MNRHRSSDCGLPQQDLDPITERNPSGQPTFAQVASLCSPRLHFDGFWQVDGTSTPVVDRQSLSVLKISGVHTGLYPIRAPTVFDRNHSVGAGYHVPEFKTAVQIAVVELKEFFMRFRILRDQDYRRARRGNKVPQAKLGNSSKNSKNAHLRPRGFW